MSKASKEEVSELSAAARDLEMRADGIGQLRAARPAEDEHITVAGHARHATMRGVDGTIAVLRSRVFDGMTRGGAAPGSGVKSHFASLGPTRCLS